MYVHKFNYILWQSFKWNVQHSPNWCALYTCHFDLPCQKGGNAFAGTQDSQLPIFHYYLIFSILLLDHATWLWLPWLRLPLRALLISSDTDVSPCYDVKLLLSKFYFASLPSTFPDTMEFSNLQLFMMWPKGLDCLLLIWALALFARWLFFTRCLRCFYLSKAFPALF